MIKVIGIINVNDCDTNNVIPLGIFPGEKEAEEYINNGFPMGVCDYFIEKIPAEMLISYNINVEMVEVDDWEALEPRGKLIIGQYE